MKQSYKKPYNVKWKDDGNKSACSPVPWLTITIMKILTRNEKDEFIVLINDEVWDNAKWVDTKEEIRPVTFNDLDIAKNMVNSEIGRSLEVIGQAMQKEK